MRRSPVDVSSPKRVCPWTAPAELVLECCSVSHWKKKWLFFFSPNRQIALGKSSNSKHAHSSPYNFKIITRLHFCGQRTRGASMQRAWKMSMSQETWVRSFDVLHSRGAGRDQQLSMFPRLQCHQGLPDSLSRRGSWGKHEMLFGWRRSSNLWNYEQLCATQATKQTQRGPKKRNSKSFPN